MKFLPKCLIFEWSDFRMVGTIAIAKATIDPLKTGPFEIRSSKSPKFEWSDSNGFRSPTVMENLSPLVP